jgi:predicted  nucleic acid-binding Zn-ribbon protein
MVQTDLSQLQAECSDWRQILRNYREEYQDAKKSLQSFCRQSLTKGQLQEVEHFDNQFHIQLINIHDLKQEIKSHEKQLKSDAAENLSDDLYARHEHLLDEFVTLENTLQELRIEFRNFTNASAC